MVGDQEGGSHRALSPALRPFLDGTFVIPCSL